MRRNAIGDSGREQRLIRTIARKGFRFVGDVREGQPSVGFSSASAGAANANEPSAHALELPDKPSIAALPFMNLSGDPDQEYFVDGVVEDIISGFSRIGWLFVVARNSSFTYKGRAWT
jgi:DNA-binding winged helix-turn-helix (wHTH) protein